MAFIFQYRKSSETKWFQSSSVDRAQLRKFLGASAPNSKAPTRRTDPWPPMMPAMQQAVTSSFPAPAPARLNNQDAPVMDAMDRGFYMCIVEKRT